MFLGLRFDLHDRGGWQNNQRAEHSRFESIHVQMCLRKKSTHDTLDAARNWERDWQEHVKSCSFQLGLGSKGMTYGDDFVHTGPTERLTEFENKMIGLYPIEAELISYGSTERIKALNRRLHWTKRGIVYQPQTC